MKNEIQQQIDKLQADLDRLKEIVSKDEPKEGEWWYADCFGSKGYLVLKGQYKTYNCSCYFTPNKRELVTNGGGFDSFSRKATDEEVLTAFTKYFRSKGFVSGKSKFKSAYDGSMCLYNEPLKFDYAKDICTNSLFTLFDKSTLTIATLIEEEKIYVGENEVGFSGDGYVRINGLPFSYNGINALLPTNPELFQKILNRLNKE